MNSTAYASVLGLGFGDCGKGRFVDALTRKRNVHTVVRFNGGSQAGHTVVEAGRQHTFSQFGSGSMVPGTTTVLLDPMVVHPTALLVEAEALGRIGLDDAFGRLIIDGQCLVITPYHQAAGRLREILRGASAHGTCGVGFGETVGHSLAHPSTVLRYQHLSLRPGVRRQAAKEILMTLRRHLLEEFAEACAHASPWFHLEEVQALLDEGLAERWLNWSGTLARHCPPASPELLHQLLTRPGHILFEGAQGILLDEWRGFHPHTTWSSTGVAAVESVARRFGIDAPIEHLGVLRIYLTRHGAGPLPTHDPELDAILPEPHNSADSWQGAFRRGHPDAILWKYALGVVGPLNGLLVSHLDIFSRGIALGWCESYECQGDDGEKHQLDSLPICQSPDLAHQEGLTGLLARIRPRYASEPVGSEEAFMERLGTVTALPVIGRSRSPAGDIF